MNDSYRLQYSETLRLAASVPRTVDEARAVINRLCAFNLGAMLFEYVGRLGSIEGLPIPLLLTAAKNLSVLGDQNLALKYLDEARRADPDFPPTLLSRGQVLMYLGRFDESAREVRRCLARAPELAQGWWLLAKLMPVSGDKAIFEEIRRQLAIPGRTSLDRSMLSFALHMALDFLGDFDGAWQALEQGCSAKRSTLIYEAAQSRSLVNLLIEQSTLVPESVGVARREGPVFIVGMHRSGTTLLEQLLCGHSEIVGLGELYDFSHSISHGVDHRCRGVLDDVAVRRLASVDLDDIGQRYLQSTRWRRGSARYFTDKLPSNFLNIGFICQALPGARILHMVRDPMETSFSNLRELFSDVCAYSYNQSELADYFVHYRRLMAHWHDRYPGRVLDVSYDALTRRPEDTIREVTSHLGIGFEQGMLEGRGKSAVGTASAVQVRQQVGRPAVPKWRAYESKLQPLAQRLHANGVSF